MRIEILDEAQEDLIKGFHFYESREPGLGSYFIDCLLSDESVLAILPKRREAWIYYPGAGPEYEGFRGFFPSKEEIDKLANGLTQSNGGPEK